MSKKITPSQEIYVAPGMRGKFINGQPIVIDEDREDLELDPTNLDHKIRIYEREVKSWFLNPAMKLLEQGEFSNSFIVLMICMAYLEGVEQYRCGRNSVGESKKFFVQAIKRVFRAQFTLYEMEELFKKTRCGLFHNGMVSSGVLFNNSPEYASLAFGSNTITINPTSLLSDIVNDFEDYITTLKSDGPNNQLRENFDKLFSVL